MSQRIERDFNTLGISEPIHERLCSTFSHNSLRLPKLGPVELKWVAAPRDQLGKKNSRCSSKSARL